MKFKTWEDAEIEFYKLEDCLSDDPDKEQARVERWIEDNNHVIEENK
jgi:hypothetical protein